MTPARSVTYFAGFSRTGAASQGRAADRTTACRITLVDPHQVVAQDLHVAAGGTKGALLEARGVDHHEAGDLLVQLGHLGTELLHAGLGPVLHAVLGQDPAGAGER